MPLRDHTAGGIRLGLELFLNFQKRHGEAPAHTFWRRPLHPSHICFLNLEQSHELQTQPGKHRHLKCTRTHAHKHTHVRARAHTCATCAMAIKGGWPPTIRRSDVPWLGLNRQKETQC